MDGREFDNLLRSLTESRRTVLGGILAALGVALGTSSVVGKKKKKKCAKKCADGCCTSKRGKCIQPAQQNATQCGTGGEICRTNCGGQSPPLPETCGATNCPGGCCAGTTCEFSTKDHCGVGGATCVACAATQDCFVGKCCGVARHTCTSDNDCCINVRCETDRNRCCVDAGSACTSDLDCCNPLERVCNGVCEIKNGFPCTLMERCEGNQPCPLSLICGECPEGWETCSDDSCCPPDQFCENQGETARCCPKDTGCQA